MSKLITDIDDNEIRVISSYQPVKGRKYNRFLRIYLPVIVVILLITGITLFFLKPDNEEIVETTLPEAPVHIPETETTAVPVSNVKGSISVCDTVISGTKLLILTPENARPRLVIGTEAINDSTIILATQAADTRADNGTIAGTFVLNGELISKGEAKAGYCSIINGELSIGVADTAPVLEQTLTAGGYFFRQYPLVVGGQIVENKPKGKSLRKALAEINGKICVAMSKEQLTFHDFSQLLVDAGARNAIYLVGSSSNGFYVAGNGDKIPTGNTPVSSGKYINYIIWE